MFVDCDKRLRMFLIVRDGDGVVSKSARNLFQKLYFLPQGNTFARLLKAIHGEAKVFVRSLYEPSYGPG